MGGWMDGYVGREVDEDRIAMIIIHLRIKKA